jgi:hypothetical protein
VRFVWNIWIGTKIALFLFKPTNAQIYISQQYIFKKQKLHEQLYKIHLECANYWNIMWHIFQYIANKMQLHAVYLYLETALHVSGGTTTHHQERIQLYVQHLVFVTPLLLPAASGR